MIQMMMSRVAHAAMGVGVLRTMVRELGRLNVDWAGQSIWSLLISLESEESRFGLVEGIQTNHSLTQVVYLHLIKTLTHGSPHEVEQGLRVCRLLTSNELSTLPILTLHIQMEQPTVMMHVPMIPARLLQEPVDVDSLILIQTPTEQLTVMKSVIMIPINLYPVFVDAV